MPKPTILIIEDEENIAELISYNLTKDGYRVLIAASGEEGRRIIHREQPGLILLDLMLPGVDGLDLCRALKNDTATQNIPVIMVTAKGEETDIVAGLEIGADDYIVKPFSPRVLVARVRAVMRRKSKAVADDDASIAFRDMSIHPGRHEFLAQGRKIQLTNMEFRILHFLASRPGWVFTRAQIVDNVRGDNYPVTDRSVDVIIVGLRKKMGVCGEYIETVRGVGYRFREEE